MKITSVSGGGPQELTRTEIIIVSDRNDCGPVIEHLRRRQWSAVSSDSAELEGRLRRHQCRCVVLLSSIATSPDGVPLVGSVRSLVPLVPVIAAVAKGELSRVKIHSLVRHGWDDLVLGSGEQAMEELVRVTSTAARHCLPEWLADSLFESVDGSLQVMIGWLLRNAWSPLSVEQASSYFGMDRTSFSKRLRSRGAPSFRELHALCRLAHVCVALDGGFVTQDRLARDLSFGSDVALRMRVYRTLGRSVSGLRGVACSHLGAAWRRAFAGGRAA